MIDWNTGIEAANNHVTDALNTLKNGLGEITSYLAQSLGKGVRTHVLLAAAMDADGLVPEDAAKAAAAIELLHMATLVHDDVIDDAQTRRGVPAAHRKFGQKNAIICGDYLLCLSLSLAAGMTPPNEEKEKEKSAALTAARFANAITGICKGEFSQHLNNANLDLDVFNYLKIISGKTAALFYLAAYSGALLGKESDNNCRALGRFGRCFGTLFQVADDCKDYEWSEMEAKKPVGNDIRSGVITLPLIMAMRKDPELRILAAEAMRAESEIPKLVNAVRKAGGAGAARAVAGRYVKWAEASLVNISDVKKEKLSALLRAV